jgi:hypothetical protein
VLYRERAGDKPHGYIEITVLTKSQGDEGGYAGIYTLTAFDGTGDDPEGRRSSSMERSAASSSRPHCRSRRRASKSCPP